MDPGDPAAPHPLRWDCGSLPGLGAVWGGGCGPLGPSEGGGPAWAAEALREEEGEQQQGGGRGGFSINLALASFIFTGGGDLGCLLSPWELAQISVHRALIIAP